LIIVPVFTFNRTSAPEYLLTDVTQKEMSFPQVVSGNPDELDTLPDC
jgi:hypothetical protein